MERTDRRAAAAHAHDRAMESPVVRLIIGKGREFGVEEWAHMVGILEGHVALQRRQDQRAVDAAMGIAAALAPPDEEMTRRAGASPAGQALLDEFGGFDAGAWPSVRAILGHYDALLRLDAAREVQPERAPLSEPLDVAAYRARKRDVLDPEAGEEE